MYIKKEILKAGNHWECVKRRRDNCHATVKTDLQMKNPVVSGEHNQNGDAANVAIARCRQELKNTAKNSRAKPKQILAVALKGIDNETNARIGRVTTLKRDINRYQQLHHPADPTSIEELVIPHEWTTTGGEQPRPFLI